MASRWPEEAVKEWRWNPPVLQPTGAFGRDPRKGVGQCRRQRDGCRHMVAQDVRGRSLRIIQMERSIVVMMMPFLLPVKGSVLRVCKHGCDRTRP